jgi:hypothetical protein
VSIEVPEDQPYGDLRAMLQDRWGCLLLRSEWSLAVGGVL